MTVITTTDAYRTRPNTSFGVDLYSNNGTVDFASLKNDGVKWAILRAYGSAHASGGDTMFEKNVQSAFSVGMPTGAYFYSMPDGTLAGAKAQADLFIAKLKKGYEGGGFGDLIPMVDVEDNTSVTPSGGVSTAKMDTTALLTWVDQFRDYFEDITGVQLGIYTGYDFIISKNNFNEGKTPQGNILKDMPLWVADYVSYGYTDAKLAGGWTNFVAWQYDYRGKFAGVLNGTQVDLSLAPIPFNLNSKKVVLTEKLVLDDTQTSSQANTIDNGDIVVTTSTTTTTTTMKRQTVKTYK